MAYTLTTPQTARSVSLSAFGAKVFRALTALGEKSPRNRALSELAMTSDDELQKRGVRRIDEVRRILGPYGYF